MPAQLVSGAGCRLLTPSGPRLRHHLVSYGDETGYRTRSLSIASDGPIRRRISDQYNSAIFDDEFADVVTPPVKGLLPLRQELVALINRRNAGNAARFVIEDLVGDVRSHTKTRHA